MNNKYILKLTSYLKNNEIIKYHTLNSIRFFKKFRVGDLFYISIISIPLYLTYNFICNMAIEIHRVTNKYRYPFLLTGFLYREERISYLPFIYEPSEGDIRDHFLYKNYSINMNRLLAHPLSFYYLTPSSQSISEDRSFYYNAIKFQFDEKINEIIKEGIVKDFYEIGAIENVNYGLKERLKNKFLYSDYVYRRDLYMELNEIIDFDLLEE